MNDGNHYRPAISPNPSADTQPSDWAYIAEGGAHIVFSYQGRSKTYATRALRVGKPSATTEPLAQAEENDLFSQWRRSILPKLLPRQLLTTSREVILEDRWYKELLAMVDVDRPDQRKSGIDFAAKGDRRGVLLEDLTSSEDDGAIAVAIEIKVRYPSPGDFLMLIFSLGSRNGGFCHVLSIYIRQSQFLSNLMFLGFAYTNIFEVAQMTLLMTLSIYFQGTKRGCAPRSMVSGQCGKFHEGKSIIGRCSSAAKKSALMM